MSANDTAAVESEQTLRDVVTQMLNDGVTSFTIGDKDVDVSDIDADRADSEALEATLVHIEGVKERKEVINEEMSDGRELGDLLVKTKQGSQFQVAMLRLLAPRKTRKGKGGKVEETNEVATDDE